MCLNGQEFYFGHDLSYVNQMEDCGAIFKENGVPKDVYTIFADHGTNLVRVRLWLDPSWWQDSLIQPDGVKPHYNDLEDVKETIQRAKEAGMQVMLGLHYSDFWADPGRQLIPRAWLNVAYSLEDLKDSVYNYTKRVLTELDHDGLMPDFVKIGNETNGGFLRHIPEENGYEPIASVSDSWIRHAQLFNAGIAAVREVGATASVNPKIVIHFSNKLNGQVWNYNNIISNGVTDFDVIGISYYFAWHGGSITELESTISTLVSSFSTYEVMVVETGYLWTTENFDAMGNIINKPDPQYLPVIPEKQLEYLVDFSRSVMRAGGKGVVFWEPAWVTTSCRTPWGTGSSHDHVVFFDPQNTNFIEFGGGNWCNPEYYTDLTTKKITFKVDMKDADISNGVFISGTWTGDPMQIVPMANEGNGIFSYFTYLHSGSVGSFFLLSNSTWEAVESVPAACRNPENHGRDYQVGLHNQTFSVQWGTCDPGNPPSQVNVTFMVKMAEDADISRGVFVVGEVNEWVITRMYPVGDNMFSQTFQLPPREDSLAYYYLTTGSWDNYKNFRENVPDECALKWGSDRVLVVPPYDTIVDHHWGSCLSIDSSSTNMVNADHERLNYQLYPNPTTGKFYIRLPGNARNTSVRIYEISGREVKLKVSCSPLSELELDTGNLVGGLYIIKIEHNGNYMVQKIVIRNS